MSPRPASASVPPAPPLKDGQALDRLIDRTERWAASYPHIAADRSRWQTDYEAKFRREAEQLATQSTAPARAFGPKDWILAVLLWLIISGGVLAMSILLMRPDPLWFWVFVGVAVAIFIIGVGFVYYDTTTPARADKRLAEKEEWLLSAARKPAFAKLEQRAAAKSEKDAR